MKRSGNSNAVPGEWIGHHDAWPGFCVLSQTLTLLESASPAVETHVGADIRSLRKARGLTLTDLCDALGRSVGWLSRLSADRPILQFLISSPLRPCSRFRSASSFAMRMRRKTSVAGLCGQVQGQRWAPEDGLKEELLSPDISGEFEMIRSVFAPGAKREVMPAARYAGWRLCDFR